MTDTMTESNQAPEAKIEQQVVAMYERHPFPAYTAKFRTTSEEMFLKMRLLGLAESDYKNKKMLDCGCGTGEFTCWYAARENQVTAIDLSRPSLEHAKAYAADYGLEDGIDFQHHSVLGLNSPDNSSDIVCSYGVLHHTQNPYRGFQNMVRVCRPGGVVIVSVYSLYDRYILRQKQGLINLLAGDDIEKRCKWGKRLFPVTARKFKPRTHDESDAILHDQFAIPHDFLHTMGGILRWFRDNDLEYFGSFGPLRVRDHIHAAALPEFEKLETTFAGYPVARLASACLRWLARALGYRADDVRTFPPPLSVCRFLVQTG